MDPITGIGLVSGILSFVGAAETILKLSRTIYTSVEGSSEATQMRLKLADSINSISKCIIPTNHPTLIEEDSALIALAQECNKLADEMKKKLQTLIPKRPKSKVQSSLAALKTLMLDSKLKDLENQLQSCCNQLHFHIAAMSSENLKALLAISKEDAVKVTQLERSITEIRQTMHDMTAMGVDSISGQILSQLKKWVHAGQDVINEFTHDRILRGIRAGFEDMSYRYQSIDSPFNDTFEWILDPNKATKFTQWLSSGNGIFHICGKLGSGKSTLVKKLCRHEKTRAELDKWRRGRKLIMADFFFYALGSDPRQKSLMGLYRTLLFQILTTNPDLTQHLLPDQWAKALSQPKIQTAFEILDDDIRQAYKRLSTPHDDSPLSGYCFAFFIDGLDEYQTITSIDRRQMVEALMDLANNASGNFKICASSRMENPFMDMLSEDTRLYLHELTKSDMDEYVQEYLKNVGTQSQRRQLASCITNKAEGVFLWVVLVVQKIRRQSDDGAKYSTLMGEVESLPTELNGLFQRILNTLGTEDRQMMNRTVSLLHFLDTISHAKARKLWLNLSDFYFLEDYDTDFQFAEDAQFPHPETEAVKESEVRARRRLRGVCRGLIDADQEKDIDFIHRSVGDFFKQEGIHAEILDKSFNSLEALCQLKLASVKQFWWDVERQNGNKDEEQKKVEREYLDRHSILIACLAEQRRKQQLDEPACVFLTCLDTIPRLSVGSLINHELSYSKTAFRIDLPEPEYYAYLSEQGYHVHVPYCHFEICHTSRVRHQVYFAERGTKYWNPFADENVARENSAVLWRDADEEMYDIEDYTIPVASPLLSELCLGQLDYPLWRIAHIRDIPLETDKLIMLVYCAIGVGIRRVVRKPKSITAADDEENNLTVSTAVGLVFLHILFRRKIVCPNLLTHLTFGDEFGFIRIAAGNQQLSIWQHFLCWWITVAAISGDFIPEGDMTSDNMHLDNSGNPEGSLQPDTNDNDENQPLNHPSEQKETSLVMETFIRNGADLQLRLKIEDDGDVPRGDSSDFWRSYALKIFLDSGETLVLDVAVNNSPRYDFDYHPYRVPWEPAWRWQDPASEAFPDSPLSLRALIDRSRLPNKDALISLIDETLSRTG